MVSERRTEDGGTVAVYSDITELKQREESLAEKSAALKAHLRQAGAVSGAAGRCRKRSVERLRVCHSGPAGYPASLRR